MSIIEVKNITKIFGATPHKMLEKANDGVGKSEMQEKYNHALGLHNINLSVEKGEIFVIMGLSGSGKSTLIRHFNRLIEPTGGQILVNGKDVTAMSQSELRQFRRESMSMVFQHFGLLPHKTVLENAAYAQTIMGVDKKTAYKKGREWLELVGLAGYEDSYPKQLSGGQQQRVGLARALAADTDIILMDEAFSALDPLIRSQMQEQLLELQEKFNKTIVFITHDLSEALRIGSRIAILNEGKMAQIGTPEEILSNPADDYVTEFVKDVNHASVLNVGALMAKPRMCLEHESVSEAIAKIKELSRQWAWLVDNEHYQGLLTLENLEQAAQSNPNATLSDVAVYPQTFSADTSIEEIVPVAIGNKYPIPILHDDGSFVGVVRPLAVVNAIS